MRTERFKIFDILFFTERLTLRRVLVIGASGMLGHVVMRSLLQRRGFVVYGTIRTEDLTFDYPELLYSGVELSRQSTVERVIFELRPDIVINCAGITKQKLSHSPIYDVVAVNSMLPHLLERVCREVQARLIHISTDCVFDGKSGMYTEDDPPNDLGLYGISKRLGEVDITSAITLRTSMIGPELVGSFGLLSWFLTQKGLVSGYSNAFFSGLTTFEISLTLIRIIEEFPTLSGIFHLSGDRISKFELLRLISKEYNCDVEVYPDTDLLIDRSLCSAKFREATGYKAPSWPQMIKDMKQHT